MANNLKSVTIWAALAAIAVSGSAKADGTVPDFSYAATGNLAIGGSFLDPNNGSDDLEIGRIVWGGGLVIPVTGLWNIQLGGEGVTDFNDTSGGSGTNTQFWGSGIGFWRDRNTGTFGVEAGIRSEGFSGSGDEFVKLGAVGEFYGHSYTVGGTFGALIPLDSDSSYDTSFYGKGWANYYYSDRIALTGFGDWTNYEFESGGEETSWRAGGKVRYKTSMPGTQAFLSAAYTEYDTSSGFEIDGVQIMGGVSINILGGYREPDSLLESDRIFGLDTAVYRAEFFSDRRLKTDIRAISVTDDGLTLYSWKYKSDPATTWVGVMAQDLETTHSEAVRLDNDGFYRVNYSRLGLRMMTLEQWNARYL